MATGRQDTGRRMTRRGFVSLSKLVGTEGLRTSASLAGFPFPVPAAEPHSLDIGTATDLAAMPPGVVSTHFAGSGQFYLVRVHEGVLALHRRCPVQACAVLWRAGLPSLPSDNERGWMSGRFVCLAHSIGFDRYGQPAAGRDGEAGPMTRLRLSAPAGRILVHLALEQESSGNAMTLFPYPLAANSG